MSWNRRSDAFELWCWRRLLRVPCMVRRSNQSILKETSLEYSLEGLTLKLKLQYFGHLMQRAYSLEKILMLGKNEHERRRGWHMMRWLDGITDSMDMSLGKLGVGDGQGGLACCGSWGHKESNMTEQLNWTELNKTSIFLCFCVFILEEFGEVQKKKKTKRSFYFLFRRWLTVPQGNGSFADQSWAGWLLVFPVKQQISTNPCTEKLAGEQSESSERLCHC